MHDLLKIIKQAAMEAVMQSEPVTVEFGTITKTEPLTVRIDQKKVLTKEFLIVTKEAKTGITTGKAVLLKVQGGQKYLILGMEGD